MKVNAIRLAAVVLAVAAAPTAIGDGYFIRDLFTEYDSGGDAACFADVGGKSDRSDITLALSVYTMATRSRAGEQGEDIYRPIVYLDGDAGAGPRRTSHGFNPMLLNCTTSPEDGRECTPSEDEYRITYSLSGARGTQEAWVFNSTDTTYNRHGGVSWSYATVMWLDYPDNLFETNESKSIRINMGGVGDGRGMRTTHEHLRHQRINYRYGAEVLKLLRACIDRHIAAGRVTPPDGTASIQEIRSGLEREARARMEARRSR